MLEIEIEEDEDSDPDGGERDEDIKNNEKLY